MHPRPFLRTSSKCRLIPSSGYESPPPRVAEVKGGPQHVVIGFHLGSEISKLQTDRCESPRSVLELNAPSASPHPEQAKSPRSVLGSLLSGHESHCPRREGVGLGVIAAIKEEEARATKFALPAPVMSKPIEISDQNHSVWERKYTVREGSCVAHTSACHGGGVRDEECDDLEVDEDTVTESIFSAASPFSGSRSLEFAACDFLSVCFFCKCHLTHGKDVYMYKGDKAFCSAECRYQQIVSDEFKERQSAAASCFMRASTRSTKMSVVGASAAVA
eukprot:c15094_g1_i1 orf=505-1329(-)